jgi:hypothetical protein
MSKTLTFAPGWTQIINTSNEVDERNDLLSYISDTYKGLYGFRPRGDTSNMTINDLREQAVVLERDVLREAEYIKQEFLRKKREKVAHKRAMNFYMNLKPRSNVMEVAMLDALDEAA